MYVLGWSSTNTLDADAAMYAVLHSGESYSTYSNTTVDQQLDEARTTSDLAKRKQLYASVEKTVVQDAPRIFLYQENTYYGVSKKIQWRGKIDASINVKDISYTK
jgi:peptide/nickel transport system substrate-binding protein